MKQEDNLLQDILSDAFQDEVNYEGHSEDYLILQSKLQKKAFYRFSKSSFNIYYASCILASFIICVSIGIHYVFHIHKSQELFNSFDSLTEKTIRNMSSSLPLEAEILGSKMQHQHFSSSPLTSSLKEKEPASIILKENKVKSKDKETGRKEKSISKPNPVSKITQVNYILTEETIEGTIKEESVNKNKEFLSPSTIGPNPALLESEEKSPKTKIQKIIIYKQDTIYKFDSVKVKSRLFPKRNK